MADAPDFERQPDMGAPATERSSEDFRRNFFLILGLIIAAIIASMIVFRK